MIEGEDAIGCEGARSELRILANHSPLSIERSPEEGLDSLDVEEGRRQGTNRGVRCVDSSSSSPLAGGVLGAVCEVPNTRSQCMTQPLINNKMQLDTKSIIIISTRERRSIMNIRSIS